jgi:hypothetical protein
MALILRRPSASRASGEWSDDDFDVLARAAADHEGGPCRKACLGCGRSAVQTTSLLGSWGSSCQENWVNNSSVNLLH